MKKTATLVLQDKKSKPRHFFVRTIDENGECLESADFNFYKKEVEKVIKNYTDNGYTIINNLPTKVEFKIKPLPGRFGRWETQDGFFCFTDNRATALKWYKNYLAITSNR